MLARERREPLARRRRGEDDPEGDPHGIVAGRTGKRADDLAKRGEPLGEGAESGVELGQVEGDPRLVDRPSLADVLGEAVLLVLGQRLTDPLVDLDEGNFSLPLFGWARAPQVVDACDESRGLVFSVAPSRGGVYERSESLGDLMPSRKGPGVGSNAPHTKIVEKVLEPVGDMLNRRCAGHPGDPFERMGVAEDAVEQVGLNASREALTLELVELRAQRVDELLGLDDELLEQASLVHGRPPSVRRRGAVGRRARGRSAGTA